MRNLKKAEQAMQIEPSSQVEQKIQLTQTVQKGGCAAKVAATELRAILARLRPQERPQDLLVGSGTFDDAAIWKVGDSLALVQTLDFFTPIVDDPTLFGRIAASNALSDVYAMGGEPKTAMAIMAFPLATMDTEVAVQVLNGALQSIEESGASLVGGHTIDDDTLKFGLSVTGYVHPEEVWTNAKAKPGDVLILTKALGTGTLTAALKRRELRESDISDALQSMCQLNRLRDLLSTQQLSSIHAATDVTGFGLAGHAFNLAKASQVSLEIQVNKVPRFVQAQDLIQRGFLTKAHRTNREYVQDHLKTSLDLADLMLMFDPQTSGGLLLSVREESAASILSTLQLRFPHAEVVGRVLPRGEGLLQAL